MKFIINLFISALILLLVSRVLPGFKVGDFWNAFLVAFVIAILNVLVKPALLLLTLPINLLTLGLFTFVISALILELASLLTGSLSIANFGVAVLAAFLIALFSAIVNIIKHD